MFKCTLSMPLSYIGRLYSRHHHSCRSYSRFKHNRNYSRSLFDLYWISINVNNFYSLDNWNEIEREEFILNNKSIWFYRCIWQEWGKKQNKLMPFLLETSSLYFRHLYESSISDRLYKSDPAWMTGFSLKFSLSFWWRILNSQLNF